MLCSICIFFFGHFISASFTEPCQVSEDAASEILSECLLQHNTVEDRLSVDSCDSEWGEFSAGHDLLATQIIVSPQLPHNFSDFTDVPNGLVHANPDVMRSGLFANREEKFAVCLIPRVGSVTWGSVFLKMMLHDTDAQGKYVWREVAALAKPNAELATAVFTDQSATRAVFVREPLERFASAFLEKCATEDPSVADCPMMDLLGEDEKPTMHKAVEWIQHADLASLDVNWLPQSYFCELQKRVGEYTVVGLYSRNNYGDDASCVMTRANIEGYNFKSPEYVGTELQKLPLWQQSDRVSALRVHSLRPFNDTAEHALMQKLFTEEGALSLMAVFHEDYTTFHFPERPTWLPAVTGDLYDVELAI